ELQEDELLLSSPDAVAAPTDAPRSPGRGPPPPGYLGLFAVAGVVAGGARACRLWAATARRRAVEAHWRGARTCRGGALDLQAAGGGEGGGGSECAAVARLAACWLALERATGKGRRRRDGRPDGEHWRAALLWSLDLELGRDGM
ncbi:unnamed protein product, partial [Urochloa humidicola]